MPTLPPELHLLILESTAQSTHPTLRLVSTFWKSKIDSLKLTHYRPPPPTPTIYKDWCTTLTPPPQSSTPFLIHSAIFNCTGVFHRVIDSKTKKIILTTTKRPRKNYEIPEEVLDSTREFMMHRNDQLIIPDPGVTPEPLERTIRLQYLMNRGGGASCSYQVLVQKGDVIGKEKGMTVGEFEEWIRRFRAKKNLVKVPERIGDQEFKKFVVQVGVESESDILTIHIEDLNRHR
ncbi:hypothetical protein TWF718_008428 [Orbilia javanica]|uniref:F-box domain-containing protein n=1 Tax=Orbilia javanica TaxID=47235 RepID=A0AAN8MRV1_9PEZI